MGVDPRASKKPSDLPPRTFFKGQKVLVLTGPQLTAGPGSYWDSWAPASVLFLGKKQVKRRK